MSFSKLIKKPVFNWLFLLLITLITLVLCSCDSHESLELTNTETKIKLITLSPHLAELAVSAGAFENIVGVVSYSDFPKEVSNIQTVGDAFKLDYETILRLKPNYILTWKGGTPTALVEKLHGLNIQTIETEINTLSDIPKTIAQIADLVNTQDAAKITINEFNKKLKQLQSIPHEPISAFIETYHQPLYTVSDKHWMSQAIEICGFKNVFADLKQQSASVTLESVILKNPIAIITIGVQEDRQWQQWQELDAVKNKNIITINPDIISRPSIRILQGIEKICSYN